MFFLSLFPYCLTAACLSNPHIWGDVSVTIYLYYLLWSLSLQKTLITKATSSLSCSENQEFSQYLPFQVMYNIPKHSRNLSSTVNFAFLLNFLSLPARASSSAWGPCHLRMTRWARTMPRTVLILQIPDSYHGCSWLLHAGHIWLGECEVSQENWTCIFYPAFGMNSPWVTGSWFGASQGMSVLQLCMELSASCKANAFKAWGEVDLRKIMAGDHRGLSQALGDAKSSFFFEVQLKTQYLKHHMRRLIWDRSHSWPGQLLCSAHHQHQPQDKPKS